MTNSTRSAYLILFVSAVTLGGPSCSAEPAGDDLHENAGVASLALTCSDNGLANTCTPRCPCASGWGDCEPGECAAGLVCSEDVGARFGFQPLFDVCLPPHCSNGTQDEDETAVDGGGSCGVCPANGAGDACSVPSCRCESGHGDCDNDSECAAGLSCVDDVGAKFGLAPLVDVCLPQHCANGVQDGGETGGDSGGSCGEFPECPQNGTGNACSPWCLCESGHGDCDGDVDCASGLACVNNVGARFELGPLVDVCLAPHCSNGVQDDETGVDSGGSCGTCPANGTNDTCSQGCPCPSGWGDCDSDADCQPGLNCLNGMGREVGLPAATDVCLVPQATFVEAGDGFNCVLRQDRSVRCWGANGWGQSMAPPGKFTRVSAGTDHACGLKGDGTVDCWGSNYDGKATPPPDQFTHISAGTYSTCGVKADATVACWGSLAFASPPPGGFSQVAVGRSNACGLKLDGTIACWGPWQTPPQLAGTFTQLAKGSYLACALRTDGRVACWQENGRVTLQPGTFKQISAGANFPCGVRLDGTIVCRNNVFMGTFTQVSAGGLENQDFQACGIKTDGSVACWGNNLYGQSMPLSTTFTQVAAKRLFCAIVGVDRSARCWDAYGGPSDRGGPFVQVSAGGSPHACGVRDDGSVDCWGNNQSGEASPPAGTFSQVAAGNVHTCGLRTDGMTICWGRNDSGQSSAPAALLVQLSAGADHTCGLRTDGTVVCWGNDDLGQLRAPSGVFTQVSAGNAHNCAVNTDGTVACWGWNDHGQARPPAGTFRRVAAGEQHTCGVTTNGTVACWGRNDDPSYPYRVGAFGQATPLAGIFSQIASGASATCGLRPTGTLACWGTVFRDP